MAVKWIAESFAYYIITTSLKPTNHANQRLNTAAKKKEKNKLTAKDGQRSMSSSIADDLKEKTEPNFYYWLT